MSDGRARGTQLRLPYREAARSTGGLVSVPGVPAPVAFVRRKGARHYILRVRLDGVVRVTVPWHGSRAEAAEFLRARREWVVRELHRHDVSRDRSRLPHDVESALRRQAARELPRRLAELAHLHGFTVTAVSIRNQRTRWGSCSPAGRISLNWRLVQVPPDVRDYVLLNELTHLRHLNHSARFWRELAHVCPGHADARRWLRASRLLVG
jgi:predicted metal-dependent hydrolase